MIKYVFLLENYSPVLPWLLLAAIVLLAISIVIFLIDKNRNNSMRRLSSWWLIFLYTAASVSLNPSWVSMGFVLLSFIALRELLSSYGLRSVDRYSVFWAYLSIPIQYYFCYRAMYYYSFIFIPVVMFLVLPLRAMLQSEGKGLIRSMAVIQWFMMIAVFCMSHLVLIISFWRNDQLLAGRSFILLYLFLVVFANDFNHFMAARIRKVRIIQLNWIDAFICTLPSIALSIALTSLSHFSLVQSIVAGTLLSLSSLFGKKSISLIKDDLKFLQGEKVVKHNIRIMSQVASLPFSALIFFHLIFYWFGGV